jgi:glucans biosynthesis protein
MGTTTENDVSVTEMLSAPMACLLLGLGLAGPLMAQTGERSPTAEAFGFDDVYLKALELAERPYQPDRPPLPAGFKDLQYDHYRDIRFRPEKSVWRDEARFRLQLFSRGFLYRDRVRINLIDAGDSKTLAFSRDMFDFGKNEVPPGSLADMGFAGFRIIYPLHGVER